MVYPKELAMEHYRMAVIDYFRFFLGRFGTRQLVCWDCQCISYSLREREVDRIGLVTLDSIAIRVRIQYSPRLLDFVHQACPPAPSRGLDSTPVPLI